MKNTNRRVYLRITNRCNKNCNFCYYKNDPKPLGDMTIETVEKIIEHELIAQSSAKWLRVELTGGEPTLCNNLKEIITYLDSFSNINVVLETNGTTLMTDKFLDIIKVFKKKKNLLKISINSELLDSDITWLHKLSSFTKFAKENNIRYVLNVRVKDEIDKIKIKKIIQEHDLQPAFGEIPYFKIENLNLYRDGHLADHGIPIVIYDFDGKILYTVNI